MIVRWRLAVAAFPASVLVLTVLLSRAKAQRRLIPIASRAIVSLRNTQGVGDLCRLSLRCERKGIDYDLAYIPARFKVVPKEPFDPEYMTKLFQV